MSNNNEDLKDLQEIAKQKREQAAKKESFAVWKPGKLTNEKDLNKNNVRR
ncbi:hypothetical protein MAH1_34040 [Sessilibacter sp. MAH1]